MPNYDDWAIERKIINLKIKLTVLTLVTPFRWFNWSSSLPMNWLGGPTLAEDTLFGLNVFIDEASNCCCMNGFSYVVCLLMWLKFKLKLVKLFSFYVFVSNSFFFCWEIPVKRIAKFNNKKKAHIFLINKHLEWKVNWNEHDVETKMKAFA